MRSLDRKLSSPSKTVIMKNILFTLIFSLAFISVSFAQGQKVLIKSFQTDSKELVVDMVGRVLVNEWDENYVRVMSSIEVNNFSEQVLMRLLMVGRYSITSETIDGALIIKMPRIADQISIKGEVLEEVLEYQIFVPRGTKVNVLGAHNYINF
jgi:hypothetical protein